MKRGFLVCIVVLGIVLVSAVAQAATEWYFPEGSTQGFDLWILVTNPNDIQASITFTFYTDDPDPVVYPTTVDANQRKTIWVNTISGLDDKPISTKVECTNGLNIYAERALYWPAGGNWTGGHTSRGISGGEGCYTEISDPGAAGTWPITISRSGSYKLVGNITNCPQDRNAIVVSADNVTIDMNGFTLTGPGASTGTSGCGVYALGAGMLDPQRNLIIKNGTIRDFRYVGIYAMYVRNVQVLDTTVDSSGNHGIYLYGCHGSRVEDCYISENGSDSTDAGLWTSSRTLIRNNVFYKNWYGIYIFSIYNRVEGNHFIESRNGANHDAYFVNTANFFINNSYTGVLGGAPKTKYRLDGTITNRNMEL